MSDTTLEIRVNGQPLRMPAGISVAAALARAGCERFGLQARGGARQVFCGMGQCQACRVEIDGQGQQLACMRLIEAGMTIRTAP